MAQRTFAKESKLILGFIGLIWLVFLADILLPVELATWGIAPRSPDSLPGIMTMPFVHATLTHIVGNTVPLFVLLVLLAGSRTHSAEVVITVLLAGGALLWCFGRGGRYHVGASGLIYGLIAFLIVAGIREKRFVSLSVAILTGLLYGSTLLFGILPTVGRSISWDGHLAGAIAGGTIALLSVRPGNPASVS